MATKTTVATGTERARTASRYPAWQRGVGAGLLGGAVMGVLLSLFAPQVLETAIPGLYGLSGGLAGWLAHMVHAAIFGLLFAAFFETEWARERVTTGQWVVATAVLYGVLLWLVAASVVLPLWSSAVTGQTVPVAFEGVSLGAHIVYGFVLGVTYVMLR